MSRAERIDQLWDGKWKMENGKCETGARLPTFSIFHFPFSIVSRLRRLDIEHLQHHQHLASYPLDLPRAAATTHTSSNPSADPTRFNAG